jgi:Phosphatidate cytidylyltransferase, mitochondrial
MARLAGYLGMGLSTSASGSPTARLAVADAALRLSPSAAEAPGRRPYQRLLRRAVGSTVRSSSARQALAGVLSAGPARSLYYVWQKLAKRWHG